jgi:hypothetical protein
MDRLPFLVRAVANAITSLAGDSLTYGRCWKPKRGRADGPALWPDGPRSGLSAVVARTVRACAESVRVPSFSRDLLPKTVGLTRKSVRSGSRPPPLYR